MSRPSTPRRSRSACPLCGKPVAAEHKPFCSQGCRDRDLLNWLGDGYRMPGPRADEEGGEIGGSGLDSDADPPL